MWPYFIVFVEFFSINSVSSLSLLDCYECTSMLYNSFALNNLLCYIIEILM